MDDSEAAKHYYSPPLYQLSYCKILWGITLDEDRLMTLGLLDPRSNQLSYKGLSNIMKLGNLVLFSNWN